MPAISAGQDKIKHCVSLVARGDGADKALPGYRQDHVHDCGGGDKVPAARFAVPQTGLHTTGDW